MADNLRYKTVNGTKLEMRPGGGRCTKKGDKKIGHSNSTKPIIGGIALRQSRAPITTKMDIGLSGNLTPERESFAARVRYQRENKPKQVVRLIKRRDNG